jgi:hypothetical protein
MPLNRDLLSKYSDNDYFIETGSWVGNGISLALDVGFDEIHSIEIEQKFAELCRDKFSDNDKVSVYLGNSADVLYEILGKVNGPSTIWLDAHAQKWNRGLPNPILKELDAISKSKYINTILIDDLRGWDKDFIDNMKDKILNINNKYNFKYETGVPRFKNDILACYS